MMALLFVGGVMNIIWIAALAGLIAIEKLAPKGEMAAHVVGGLMICAGVVRLVLDLPLSKAAVLLRPKDSYQRLADVHSAQLAFLRPHPCNWTRLAARRRS
jgi:hypothetical protein